MRPFRLSKILLTAALLVGCGVDNIQAPLSSARPSLLDHANSRPGEAFVFTAIDVPNATFTGGSGINARGDIVGTYRDVDGRSHGYLLRNGEVTTIDFPDAAGAVVRGTDARGIGPGGEIVGSYTIVGEPAVNVHGFVLTTHGEFVAVNYPGHTNTIAQRILPDGTILGCRHDNNTMDSMKGIVITQTDSAEISQFASMNNGATPDHRQIVGLFTNMAGSQRGYLIDDGVFTPLFVGDIPATAAWDMNPAGEIVGVFNKAGIHGFVLRDEDYVQIDFPGATATRAFGINPRGDVVGTYITSDGKSHGFLASR